MGVIPKTQIKWREPLIVSRDGDERLVVIDPEIKPESIRARLEHLGVHVEDGRAMATAST